MDSRISGGLSPVKRPGDGVPGKKEAAGFPDVGVLGCGFIGKTTRCWGRNRCDPWQYFRLLGLQQQGVTGRRTCCWGRNRWVSLSGHEVLKPQHLLLVMGSKGAGTTTDAQVDGHKSLACQIL